LVLLVLFLVLCKTEGVLYTRTVLEFNFFII